MSVGLYKGGTKGGAGSGCREVSSPQTSQLRIEVESAIDNCVVVSAAMRTDPGTGNSLKSVYILNNFEKLAATWAFPWCLLFGETYETLFKICVQS